MKCPQSHPENPEGAKFCNEPAHKLEFICPEFGPANPQGSKFGNECAYALRINQKIPPIDYSTPQSDTPKHLKDKILTTPSSIEGERKLVTVFFADVAHYTSLSEQIGPEVTAVMLLSPDNKELYRDYREKDYHSSRCLKQRQDQIYLRLT